MAKKNTKAQVVAPVVLSPEEQRWVDAECAAMSRRYHREAAAEEMRRVVSSVRDLLADLERNVARQAERGRNADWAYAAKEVAHAMVWAQANANTHIWNALREATAASSVDLTAGVRS